VAELLVAELLAAEFPLNVPMILRRAVRHAPDKLVTTRTDDGFRSVTWAQVGDRITRLADALRRSGVRTGDRVASFAWNGQRHLELYFAVPCAGAVLHTLNVRLAPDQLAAMIGQLEDRMIFLDPTLVDGFAPVLELLGTRAPEVVIMDDSGYEELLATGDSAAAFPDINERAAAVICHSSGTTGQSKAVAYTHRSEVLHAFGATAADGFAVSESDTILLLAPMFHVNGWGLPYAAALTGANLVFTGARTDPATILDAVASQSVTMAAAVPTVWIRVLETLAAQNDAEVRTLRRVLIGGAASTPDLIDRFAAYGVAVLQGWGMTETAPNAAVARIRSNHRSDPAVTQTGLLATQGIAVPGVEVRICADDGTELAWDGVTAGELEVRGLWVAGSYLGMSESEHRAAFHDGWLRTGDIATLTPDGYLRLVDRKRDLIKSGGEWISSLELEQNLADHPAVSEAAVVGVPHPKWGERPIALVMLASGAYPTAEALREHLVDRVPRWWIPDEFRTVAEIPRTSVGKYDKKRIRHELAAGENAEGAAHAERPDRA
jgi:fatty-acyl-CoA synthase